MAGAGRGRAAAAATTSTAQRTRSIARGVGMNSKLRWKMQDTSTAKLGWTVHQLDTISGELGSDRTGPLKLRGARVTMHVVPTNAPQATGTCKKNVPQTRKE
eukprot:gene9369-biopygen3209